MSRQFSPTNKNTPCPICDDITGKCRMTEQEMLLCMTFTSAQAVPGWRFTKLTKNQLWGTWVPDNGNTFDPEKWKAEKADRETTRKRKQDYQRRHSLIPSQRNKYYRQLLASLKLHPDDREDLIRRGFSDEEIAAAGFKSVEKWQKLDIDLPVNLPGVSHNGKNLITGTPGYLCPCYDHKGRIVGMQVRFRKPRGKQRYGWLSSATSNRPNGAPPALLNGENPLTVVNSTGYSSPIIYLAEGTGAKPWLAEKRLQLPVIGAAGGMWGSSPQTLQESLQAISQAKPQEVRVVLIPDAGDASNPQVRPRNESTIKALTDFGYGVRVMWWGQILKSDLDIDHQPENFKYKLITPEDFWAICDREKINVEARKAQAEINSLSYKPALEFASKFLPDLHLPKPGSFLFIDSPMGSGKTFQTKRLIGEFFQKNANGLVRFFGYRNGLLRQTLENLQVAFPDRCIDLIHDLGAHGSGSTAAAMLSSYDVVGLCVDSLLKIDERSLDGALIFLDEVDAIQRHLLLGNTLTKRGIRERVMAKFQAIIQRVLSTGGYVVAMESNLTDLSINLLKGLSLKAPAPLIVNRGEVEPWDVTVLVGSESSELVEAAHNGYFSGLKQVVACDSQAFAAELEGLLARLCPEAKVTRVDGTTSETDEVRSLMSAPNAWIEKHRPDFLIYTPTLESGADITTDHFDRMLFYLVNLETRAQMQMLNRVRLPIPRFGYVKESAFSDEDGGRSLRPDVLFRESTRNVKSAIHLTKLAVAMAEQSPEGSDSWVEKLNEIVDPKSGSAARHWIEAWSGFKARENGARAEMRANLLRTLRRHGHNVVEKSATKSPIMTETRKVVRETLQQKEAETLADEDSGGITPDIAYKILSSANASEKKRRQARKALLEDRLPGIDLNADFLLEAIIRDRGQLLKRIAQLWDVKNLEVVKKLEQAGWIKRMEHPFVFFPGIRHRALKAELLSRSGVLNFIESEEPLEFQEGYEDKRLQDFFDWCWWNRFEIRRVLGLTISQKTSPLKNLGKFVRKLGYELVSRKIGSVGNQIRLWRIVSPEPAIQAEILAALTRKQTLVAEAISTTQSIYKQKAGVDIGDLLWDLGTQVRVKESNSLGVVTAIEPDLAVVQLPDGSEWVYALEQLEVAPNAA